MLFWACWSNQDIDVIESILKLTNLYIEMPLHIINEMNCFHSCALNNGKDIIKYLLDISEWQTVESLQSCLEPFYNITVYLE